MEVELARWTVSIGPVLDMAVLVQSRHDIVHTVYELCSSRHPDKVDRPDIA